MKLKKRIDTINCITAKTIIKDQKTKRRLISELYFYSDSKKLLGVENTYMDYTAFKTVKTRFKNISKPMFYFSDN